MAVKALDECPLLQNISLYYFETHTKNLSVTCVLEKRSLFTMRVCQNHTSDIFIDDWGQYKNIFNNKTTLRTKIRFSFVNFLVGNYCQLC